MQARVKVCALAVVVLTAYHYSLSSLLQTVSADTPLAYLGLVPVIAAGMAALQSVPRRPEPPIHDRELDYILGLPLVAAAVLAMIVVPKHLGAMFWVQRLDLLTLPVFVGGATILLFGTRVAWRQRVPILYLLLAWPWPYVTILLGALGGFTSVTLAGLKAMLRVIPVAHAIRGADNAGLFEVTHHGRDFPVSVVTACSGIDGMVGFLLVGVAFAALIKGPFHRKATWLALGLALLWVSNLARLMLIFWVGREAGQHLALDILHPVAGIAFFCIGQVLMILLLKPFGLRLADGVSMTNGLFPSRPTHVRPSTHRIFAAGAMLAVVGVVLGVNDSGLKIFDPVSNAAGQPKLGSFLAKPATPAGWSSAFLTEYTINKPLFGQSSRWFRYIYSDVDNTVGNLHSRVPITADVINAAGLSGFSNFGVSDCYTFHGYTLRDVAQVNLGHGISGQALSYTGTSPGTNWTLVYWIWPVATSKGTRYERVILYLQNTGSNEVTVGANAPDIVGLKGALRKADPVERTLLVNRAFIVAFGQEIISAQLTVRDTAADISALNPGQGNPVGPSQNTVAKSVATAASQTEVAAISQADSTEALKAAWSVVRGQQPEAALEAAFQAFQAKIAAHHSGTSHR